MPSAQQIESAPAPAPVRDVLGVAEYRRERGRDMSEVLVKASMYYASLRPVLCEQEALDARAAKARRAWAVAQMIRDCASRDNLWLGRDLLRQDDGELYEATGTLTSCGSRLCPSCTAKLRSHARTRARTAMKNVEVSRGLLWRFVTLTAPTCALPLLDVLRIYQAAWALLRKRSMWRGLVVAAVKGVEFTVNAAGYHVHIHTLALSKWIPRDELRREWTECISKAFEQAGQVMPAITTHDGLCLCDVRLVRSKRVEGWRERGSIGLDDAVNECVKYLTKSESWDKVPALHLVEVAAVKRWPRMFEILGAARGASSPAPAGETFLDTQSLSDGQVDNISVEDGERARPPTILDLVDLMTPHEWLEKFLSRQERYRRWRRLQLIERYTCAEFITLSGDLFNYASYLASHEHTSRLRRRHGRDERPAYSPTCPLCLGALDVTLFCFHCRVQVSRDR